jgi:purine/pyrimidine-nucleoside phosphorylase
MEKFSNVTVTTAANIYFDGKVTSRTIELADGTIKTLGIMMPGEYEFGTAQPELMEITVGLLLVKLPGSDTWAEMPGNAKFQLDVKQLTDYVCSYL